jgi:hypothetical protein
MGSELENAGERIADLREAVPAHGDLRPLLGRAGRSVGDLSRIEQLGVVDEVNVGVHADAGQMKQGDVNVEVPPLNTPVDGNPTLFTFGV